MEKFGIFGKKINIFLKNIPPLIHPFICLYAGQYGLPPKKDQPAGRTTSRIPGKQKIIPLADPSAKWTDGRRKDIKKSNRGEREGGRKEKREGGDRWRMCSGDICRSLFNSIFLSLSSF